VLKLVHAKCINPQAAKLLVIKFGSDEIQYPLSDKSFQNFGSEKKTMIG